MRYLFMIFSLAAFAMVAGCSGDDGNAAQAPQQEQGSSSLSVDTEDGSFSYEEDSGNGSTSIQVGDSDNEDDQGK